MRVPFVALGLLVALTVMAPLSQATCHFCLQEAVDDCSGLDMTACAASTVHLATHAPDVAEHAADDPEGFVSTTVDPESR